MKIAPQYSENCRPINELGRCMLLTISTTHRPASDLGYLLEKHPARVHEIELAGGKATVFYSEASVDRLYRSAPPRSRSGGAGARPPARGIAAALRERSAYAASSLLSVALNAAFRSALGGRSRQRAELAATPIPLQAVCQCCAVGVGRMASVRCSSRWATSLLCNRCPWMRSSQSGVIHSTSR
ncbi:MAG: hypothetical protein HC872_08370 [Gammaproteobacteria bacterium]|nr:hypothetical protein [Gammaproteobacteria bacterium]